MTVLFKSCLAYDCDLFTPLELSCFVAHEMTQCVASWWGLLRDSQLRRSPHARGKLLLVRSFPIGNRQGVEDPCRLRSERFVG